MSPLRRFTLFLAAFVALVSLGVTRAAPAPSLDTPSTLPRNMSTEAAAALRVLIVGDSITQGHEGDYTWRYRIWQWFNSQSILPRVFKVLHILTT